MRRPFIVLLALAQSLAGGWTVLDTGPATPCSTAWRVAKAPAGGAAAQPREERARSQYAMAAQVGGEPRTTARRAAPAFGPRLAGMTRPAPVGQPLRAVPSLVLRI